MAVMVSPAQPRLASSVHRRGPERGGRRFAPPPIRIDGVPRRAPLRRLRDAGDVPVVVLCAPAGFGKTTLLRQWAGSDARRVAWLSLGPEHRDAAQLQSDLLGALEDLRGAGRRLRSAPAPTPLGRIRRAVSEVRPPALLVLDDAHLIDGEEGLDAVGLICDGLPPGAQLALACRAEPRLRWGRLRSRGLVLRLGPAELALEGAEAVRLLGAAGVAVDAGRAADLCGSAEGWPAALYLAARCGESALGDFVEREILGELTPAEVDLLTRGAVLDRLSPAACDAVLGTTGSGPVLLGLVRRGLLVPGGSPASEGYRARRPLGDVLRGRLALHHPELIAGLHRGASDWFAAAGDGDRAIGHAAAARDPERLEARVHESLPHRLATGRLDAVRGWLASRSPDEIAATPALLLAAGWCGLEGGGDHEPWIGVASCMPGPARAGNAGATVGAVALLAAAVASEGAHAMLEASAAARGGLPQHSPWLAASCALEGIARDLTGDRDGALHRLREGARRAGPQWPWITLLSRSWLGFMAQREGAWRQAEQLCAQVDAALGAAGLGEYASAALAHASAARLLARAGRPEEARRRRARARALLAVAPEAAPWRAVAARVLLARASALLDDAPDAGALLDEADEPLAALGDAAALREDVAQAREAAGGLAPGERARRAPLTPAETRVLHFLPTHLSFRDIGVRLHLSRFTVKSQALAVYRKLGASSRGDAVSRARALGLLDPAAAG